MKRLYTKIHDGKTWKWSNKMMVEAVDAIVKQTKTNTKFDIPYVAGYSKDGKTIFIDKDVPSKVAINGRSYDLDRYLIIHETVEKSLMEQLDLDYFFAHQIALRVEQQAVEADGLSWAAYDQATQKLIKEDAFKKITCCPRDLDLAPYADEYRTEKGSAKAGDLTLIEHMKQHMTKD